MTARYHMLALDLDGTLLGPDGKVSAANIRAVADARAAGLIVIVCTGRGLAESLPALRAIGQLEPVVVVGGAIIACPREERTLHRFTLDPELAEHAVERVLAHGHAALVLKDPVEAGYDYLVVRGPERFPLDPVTHWWFREMRVRVREVAHLHEDEHPEHTVRVGACGKAIHLARIKSDLQDRARDRAVIHHFQAVAAPDHATRKGEPDELQILEVFDRGAGKWSALQLLARQLGLDGRRIAAIGDEINDVEMIAEAALGVAMGNAIEPVRAVAQRHTDSNRDDGVARAIEKILSGEW